MLVPLGVVTVISTVLPAVPDGEVIVMDVPELTVRLVPAVLPNLTAEAPMKFVPVTVTIVFPDAEPVLGEIPVTVGAP